MAKGDDVVGRSDVVAAAQRCAGRLRHTPVLTVEPDGLGTGVPVTLKLELFQHSGSFKARGALNCILAAEVPTTGVIAASGGNHGLAVAHAARSLGLPAEVFVPTAASPVKVARLHELGAVVTQTGQWYADALAASTERAEQTGALVVHAYDDPDVLAGQGTVALELAEQAPDLDTVLVAVGGGGLIGGVTSWYDGRTQVVSVEPARIPTMAAALAAGHPVDVEVGGVAADSLGAGRIGALGLAAAQRTGVVSVLVTDEAILDARRRLWDTLRLASEAGGAAALAALTSGAYRPSPSERLGVIVCGGNTDPRDLLPEQ